jgi:NAD(P)-dependent dehydrogenase (short-subunit alcohol dehydrogenase family)
MGLLEDQVAVVTGGASGIGRESALAMAREGADVVVADVQSEPREDGAPTHELIVDETDADAEYVDCDVTDYGDLEAAMAAADSFGGVTCMVNNAGIFRSQPALEVDHEQWTELLRLNVDGTFFGAQVAARSMIENDREGSIVNLSSVAGLQGSASFVPYCTSKGAVRLMTYALAAELGPEGVRVNAVHPGLIETAMTTEDVPVFGSDLGESVVESNPLRRAGQPADVAGAVVYLASDLASYVNGESLVVDGGMTNTG